MGKTANINLNDLISTRQTNLKRILSFIDILDKEINDHRKLIPAIEDRRKSSDLYPYLQAGIELRAMHKAIDSLEKKRAMFQGQIINNRIELKKLELQVLQKSIADAPNVLNTKPKRRYTRKVKPVAE